MAAKRFGCASKWMTPALSPRNGRRYRGSSAGRKVRWRRAPAPRTISIILSTRLSRSLKRRTQTSEILAGLAPSGERGHGRRQNFNHCVKEQLQNVNKESTYLNLDGGNADAGHFVHAMK